MWQEHDEVAGYKCARPVLDQHLLLSFTVAYCLLLAARIAGPVRLCASDFVYNQSDSGVACTCCITAGQQLVHSTNGCAAAGPEADIVTDRMPADAVVPHSLCHRNDSARRARL